MSDKIYTLAEIQEFFKISKPTAINMVHAEGFPKIIVGKRLLIPKKALEQWCVDNTVYYKLESLQSHFKKLEMKESSKKTY